MTDRLAEIRARWLAGYEVSFGRGFDDVLDTQAMKGDVDWLSDSSDGNSSVPLLSPSRWCCQSIPSAKHRMRFCSSFAL